MKKSYRRILSIFEAMNDEGKRVLYGATPAELEEIAGNAGWPRYTARQIAGWMYRHHAVSFAEMTDLPIKVREALDENYTLEALPPSKVSVSSDGTKKYLFPVRAGRSVEAAYIPDGDRATLCVSSQVGCRMGCRFCMTARQGFQSNLSAAEILNQIRSLPERDRLTNIVFMGMGEPLDNYAHVIRALNVLTASWGMAMSPRRITVSTIGILGTMKRFLNDSECHLAVSLHSPFDEERRQLMPVQNNHPISEVIKTLRAFDLGRQRRISFEYIMFKGLNDTPAHVNQLARLLNGLRCRINLIRFHPIPDAPYRPSDEETISNFIQALNKKGIRTTLRASRGQDIEAACGLLSTREMNKS
ncbi:MAG: 23S rRNA (adenine(2503)-C(2))-methyltransferase RlmN [Bacteroidales bacterium]